MHLWRQRLSCFLWPIDALIRCFLRLGIMLLSSGMISRYIFWEDIINKDMKAFLFFIDMIMRIENGSK